MLSEHKENELNQWAIYERKVISYVLHHPIPEQNPVWQRTCAEGKGDDGQVWQKMWPDLIDFISQVNLQDGESEHSH